MSYVILNPHSLTNTSDKYRVVKYQDWIHNADGATMAITVEFEADDRAAAQQVADRLNNRSQA